MSSWILYDGATTQRLCFEIPDSVSSDLFETATRLINLQNTISQRNGTLVQAITVGHILVYQHGGG